jgi:hypothetical protein
MPENDLTNHDLARLLLFYSLHGGKPEHVPHGGLETHGRFAEAGLATLTEEPVEIPNGCDVHNCVRLEATITPEGQAVVEAMVAAGRATAAGITLDIPEPIR